MSKWVRGIYNSAANFVMSGSLRAASGRTMDRNSKHLHQVGDQSDQRDKSCESSESIGCTPATCTCAGTTANSYRIPCKCSRTSAASTGSSATSSCSTAQDGKLPNKHGDSCTCSLCRDYLEYANFAAGIRTEGQGAGSRIRVSNEPRIIKQANNGSAGDVEHITGIQPGVTI